MEKKKFYMTQIDVAFLQDISPLQIYNPLLAGINYTVSSFGSLSLSPSAGVYNERTRLIVTLSPAKLHHSLRARRRALTNRSRCR